LQLNIDEELLLNDSIWKNYDYILVLGENKTGKSSIIRHIIEKYEYYEENDWKRENGMMEYRFEEKKIIFLKLDN
jgi:ABC-type uncharacterized transport system fused permease/ATPase subunit